MPSYRFRPTRGTPEIPLRASAQARYDFAADLQAEHGALHVATYKASQRLAQGMNTVREVKRYPESAVRAGELYAAALVQELLRLIIARYLGTLAPDTLKRAYTQLETSLGRGDLERTLARYVALFPPRLVAEGAVSPDAYLTGEQEGIPHRQIALESLLLVYLANYNPAMARLGDLFDDSELKETHYREVLTGLETFFAGEPEVGGSSLKLFAALRDPIDASPNSLAGQLEQLRSRWAVALDLDLSDLLSELVRTLDTLREETKPNWGGAPGPVEVLDPAAQSAQEGQEGGVGLEEYERFSQDSSWMPSVVLLAKSTFVWLGQLSKQYGYDITRLDQIPDEELDELARRGFTGLWLIGLWERSKASKTIKNLRGNPDAVASAYSLYDYVIADDLGGYDAFENLRVRAWQRGVRVASDMVPNHVGIDGKWVIEHPEWFLQLERSPYPSYTFNGPDLSEDDRVGIFLEDHYYDSSDAAVVFKRVDRNSGHESYIYHGNDGTSMPWNDTAQIDYLNPAAREAVIQTILHVARLSPIIRFDAAMTLAKKHVQRLWYPEPGSGGAIASRAQYGSLSRADFEQAIPEEFWREVVDRVAQEVPDTLLLAEAFWMMEGYFVRTLGMHRVYNSAFMHMFKNEDNAKYRLSIKNVLEFEPQILKRFVNFMNNPDEETAVAQFGKDDKYFGVAVMMATMPGLPMFGHGQFEGYTEKYGMEYRRAKLDENPDGWLIDRHYREIVPLLHRRKQFAEVDNFQLYDLHTDDGVDENVFVYSNREAGETSLVVFNNAFGQARGWIREATPQADKGARTLAEGLGLRAGERDFVSFRDQVSNQTFLRRSRDLLGGMALQLDAFKYQVFLDFSEIEDTDGRYARLHDKLGARGVYDLGAELESLQLEPLHRAFAELVSGEVIRTLRGERGQLQQTELQRTLPERLADFTVNAGGQREATEPFESRLNHLVVLPSLETLAPDAPQRVEIETELTTKLTDAGSGTLYVALVLDTLQEAGIDVASLRLETFIHRAFMDAGAPDADRSLLLSRVLRRYGSRYTSGAAELLEAFGEDTEVQRFVVADEAADTFEVQSYREATVRPLAYALLLEPSKLEALVPVMNDLAAAETRAEGRWSALGKVEASDEEKAETAAEGMKKTRGAKKSSAATAGKVAEKAKPKERVKRAPKSAGTKQGTKKK